MRYLKLKKGLKHKIVPDNDRELDAYLNAGFKIVGEMEHSQAINNKYLNSKPFDLRNVLFLLVICSLSLSFLYALYVYV